MACDNGLCVLDAYSRYVRLYLALAWQTGPLESVEGDWCAASYGWVTLPGWCQSDRSAGVVMVLHFNGFGQFMGRA
jgi:hypothetical protein